MINKLMEFYITNKSRPFKWGEWDCSIVGKSWVKFAINKDVEIPVCKSLKEYKGYNLIDIIDSIFERTDNPYSGDIALFNNNQCLPTVGIMCNDKIISIEKYGLTAVCHTPETTWSLN